MTMSAITRSIVLVIALILFSFTSTQSITLRVCHTYTGHKDSSRRNISWYEFIINSSLRVWGRKERNKRMYFLLSMEWLGLLNQTSTHSSPFAQADFGNNFGVIELIKRIKWPNLLVTIILLAMLLWTTTLMIRRYWLYHVAKRESREYAPRVAQALKNDNVEEAILISVRYRRSHLATLVNAALQEFNVHESARDISDEELEASKRSLWRAITIQSVEFKRGLLELKSISSTALMLGLFGMVLGLIQGLRDVQTSESAKTVDVVAGVSNGLLVLALGLVVQIMAKWLFNTLTEKLKMFTLEWENTASELISYIEKNRARQIRA